MTADTGSLAERLETWMAHHREGLDELMRSEGSRALHEEFILAEGGMLPDPSERIERARSASIRAWLRHLARAIAAERGDEAFPERLEARFVPERLEQLVLEESALTERRGRSDPKTDARREQLVAWMRIFGEGVGEELALPGGGPATGKLVAKWWRENEHMARDVAANAEAAWTAPAGDAQDGNPYGRVPDKDRVQEAALVWGHVRALIESLEVVIGDTPPAEAR